MTDIVERLRVEGFAVSAAVAYEAADEIERLRQRVAELEAELSAKDIFVADAITACSAAGVRIAAADALLLRVKKGGYPHGMATLLLDIDAHLEGK